MKYHWLQCRMNQSQFHHYMASGKSNNGDYATKHHTSIQHQAMRLTFLTPITALQKLGDKVKHLPPCSKGVLDIWYPTIIYGQ